MSKIYYQCSNCGKRFATSPIPGVAQGMYYSGCRVVGSAFYCEDCVKSWKERNGKEFDEQYRNQVNDKSKLKKCKQLANGDFYEC